VDSKLLASSSEDGRVKVWEMQEGKQARSWTAHDPGVLSVSYARDGRLVTCGRDNAVTLWEGNGNKVRTLAEGSDLPLRAVLSQDGKRVFAGDFSGHLLMWNAEDGKRGADLDPNPARSAGKKVATGKTAQARTSGGGL
jgi:WD40 repeat protein